jgi:hypothetical protein
MPLPQCWSLLRDQATVARYGANGVQAATAPPVAALQGPIPMDSHAIFVVRPAAQNTKERPLSAHCGSISLSHSTSTET